MRRILSYFKLPNKVKENQFRRSSYSQNGEDLIVRFLFDCLGISNPSYLDIGAHHPYYLNNTALFYESGSRGINVEPDPMLYKNFLLLRQEDININVGIANISGIEDFYIINTPTLNTFNQNEVKRYIEEGYKIENILKIKTKSITDILEIYANNQFPQFLSIDTEGNDEMIIDSIDFTKSIPIIICVETISFSEKRQGVKNNSLCHKLNKAGYLTMADTHINTIFVKEELWRKFV